MIDWIFPSLCRECSVFIPKNSVFCSTCKRRLSEKIKSVSNTTISVCRWKYCSGQNHSTDNKITVPILAISRYEGSIKKLVLRKKRTLFQMSGDKVASRQLGQLMYEQTSVHEGSFDFIVPIPLHWTRYIWRGFNQSYEMGRVISKRMGIPIVSALKRVRRTKFQSKLSLEQREESVKNIFTVKNKYKDNPLRDKSILIVDDLYTTGATLRNAVKPLVECGVKKITAAVACRV